MSPDVRTGRVWISGWSYIVDKERTDRFAACRLREGPEPEHGPVRLSSRWGSLLACSAAPSPCGHGHDGDRKNSDSRANIILPDSTRAVALSSLFASVSLVSLPLLPTVLTRQFLCFSELLLNSRVNSSTRLLP